MKLALPKIIPALAYGFNSSTTAGYFPKHFGESITILLRKPNKLDYSIPKMYRQIALFNTMGKIMQLIIAICLNFSMESHKLLTRSHISEHNCTLPENTLHFIKKKISFV